MPGNVTQRLITTDSIRCKVFRNKVIEIQVLCEFSTCVKEGFNDIF